MRMVTERTNWYMRYQAGYPKFATYLCTAPASRSDGLARSKKKPNSKVAIYIETSRLHPPIDAKDLIPLGLTASLSFCSHMTTPNLASIVGSLLCSNPHALANLRYLMCS
ncbi:Os12g0167801 [Oryza sativa Japonica Group]|uniref:Os12g0167801 protein n=1 Tax=Oryza sativa subsp. japonica TaxID=39947 RepID=A0A0P0Y7H6_ORYSJ|nr:Os12g0167801 [Oryza sativa Japonica Group]